MDSGSSSRAERREVILGFIVVIRLLNAHRVSILAEKDAGSLFD